MINYFDSPRAAKLYNKGRPYYHHGVLAMVASHLQWKNRFPIALDVGCGTGLSTRALLPYSEHIIGIDVSPAMIAEAYGDPRIEYHVASAESLPVRDSQVNLLTLCEAFHWLEQKEFLEEVHRVMAPKGIFLAYGGGIRGAMQDVPEFAEWFRNVHLLRYPHPPRHSSFSIDNGVPHGFEVLYVGTQEQSVAMTASGLADFFLTVSNTLQYLEQTGESPEEHHDFLVSQLLPFYNGDKETVRYIPYGGLYYILRKT